MKARATNPKTEELLGIIDDICNGKVQGWIGSRAASGLVTLTGPRGVARVKAQLDEAYAESKLTQLRGMQLLQLNAVKAPARKPKTTTANKDGFQKLSRTRVPSVRTATKTPSNGTAWDYPPGYEPDPPAADGPVRRLVMVTPAVAKMFLAREWHAVTSDGRILRQRPWFQSTVDEFCARLRDRKMVAIAQGLGIGTQGSLYDGSHRCRAIVETGIACELWVEYNMSADQLEALDSSRSRTTAVKLGMEGFEHSRAFAAATRLLRSVDEFSEAMGVDAEIAEELSEWPKWPNVAVPDHIVRQLARNNTALYERLIWAVEAKQRKPALNVPAVAVFAFIADRAWPMEKGRCRKSRDGEEAQDRLEEFLNAVVKGIGIDSETHIAIWVREWLEKNKLLHPRAVKEAHLALLLWAWDLFARDKKRRSELRTLSEVFVLPYSPA